MANTGAIAQGQQQQTSPETAALVEVLGLLAPLRTNQTLQQRHAPALAELFEALNGLAFSAANNDAAQTEASAVAEAGAAPEQAAGPPQPDSTPAQTEQDIPTSVPSSAPAPSDIPQPQVDVWQSLAGLAEGPLLRIAAQLPLASVSAFSASDTTLHENTDAAIRALTEAINRVREELRTTTAAIEQEREEARNEQEGERAARQAALNVLTPLRVGLASHGSIADNVAQLFGMLEQPAERELDPEAEAALDARIEEARARADSQEAALRAQVAEGNLSVATAVQ